MTRLAEQAERFRRAAEAGQWAEALEALKAQAAALESDPNAAAAWDQVRELWEWGRRQALAARTMAAAELGRLARLRQYHGQAQAPASGRRWSG